MLESVVIKNAVLQVVCVESNNRIYISDGKWKYTYAMIDDEKNSIVDNEQMTRM